MCSFLSLKDLHVSLHSVFHPGPFFQFYNIFSRAACRDVCNPLFDASVKILGPMFDIAVEHPDVVHIEASLGPKYFHGMTMLAALASRSLQERVSAHSAISTIPIEVLFRTSGINATVAADDKFIGRADKMERISRRVRPLFETQGGQDRSSLVLVRGQPGCGKSCLAKQQLCLVQNEFFVTETSTVISNCILGRGSDAVRDELHKMGLDLRFRLNVGSEATAEIVLPLLRDFLSTN